MCEREVGEFSDFEQIPLRGLGRSPKKRFAPVRKKAGLERATWALYLSPASGGIPTGPRFFSVDYSRRGGILGHIFLSQRREGIMRGSVFLLLVVFSGCFSAAAMQDKIREKAAPHVGCPASEITMENFYTNYAGFASYKTDGCGRQFACSTESTTGVSITKCDEFPESKEKTTVAVVVDRLSLETNCPKEKITVVNKTDWSSGSESAYRMDACGTQYVCTTAAGRTDCKQALQ